MPSSLDLLQFQPIRWGFAPETCANNDNKEYCNLVQDEDIIRWQIRRKLGNPLGCSLSDFDSTQLLLNPNFTGSATSWLLSGGWTYNANTVFIAAAGSGHVFQTFGSMVDNAIYQIIVTTTATSFGGINILLSGATIGTIPDGTAAGAYTFYGVADTGTSSVVGINGTGITTTVTSIEMFRYAPCFTIDVVNGTFLYDPSAGISINGTVNINVTLPFETSSVYSVKTTIQLANIQTGTIEFGYDSDFSGAITASNGTMNWTNNGNNLTTLGIDFNNFIGNVTSISFQQLSTDYYFALYDLDGNYIRELNSFIQYCRDYIVGSIDPHKELFDYGCYKIGIYDPFLHSDQLEFEYDFTTIGVGWGAVTGAVWALVGGTGEVFTSANPNGEIRTTEASPDFEGAWYKIKYETGALTGAGIGATNSFVELQNGTSSALATLSDVAVNNTIYQGAVQGDAGLTISNFGLVKPAVGVTGATGGDVIVFKNAYYKIYPYHLDYLSNCFTFQQSIPCSKLIYALIGNNMGFNGSNCSFAIEQRFRNLRIVPNYKINANDFISSDGTRILVSGMLQKVYTLLFDYTDELTHDVIATLAMCKAVYIYEDGSSDFNKAKRYFILPQDYQPEWEKDGKLNLAMGRLQIIEYDQIKFTTNCQ